MVVFDFICQNCGEAFEGWFGNSDEYKIQKEKSLVNCPTCDSHNVEKQLSAPAVSKKANQQSSKSQTTIKPEDIRKIIKDFRKHVFDNFENVGSQFAKESLKIHYGETEERNIYGTVTKEEAVELAEEGVKAMPLPSLPKDN